MERIGKYKILDRIGQGAMGEVFRAHDPILDRPVALKVINANDEERRQRFHREAQSAARLTHPNIVVVHDFGEASGRFFMAMELLDGTDFKRAIATNRLTDLASKLHAMQQVCDAVAFAHARSVIHRDLKPANIFLLPNGAVKILDFGLARIDQSDMTGTGMILGTPNYMSPEQIQGRKVDARADVFALGAVFYELLAGRKAFDGDSLHNVLYKVLQVDPEPLHSVAPSLPSAVAEIVTRALIKTAEARYQSALEMRDAIHAARGGDPSLTILTSALSPTLSRSGGSNPLTGSGARSGSGTTYAGGPVTLVGELGSDMLVNVKPGQTILAASLEAGVRHVHECGGNARCSTCRVLVLEGSRNLSPRDSAELKLARRLGFSDDIRLACQTRVQGAAKARRLLFDSDDVRIARAEAKSPTAGMETPLAVLSANIREFATLTKRSLAYDVVHILNRYYLQIGDAVLANGGHIDRYQSGGLVALFGVNGEDARAKCTNAVRAALRMQKRMELFNVYLHEHFGLRFTLDIGLHYGRMIVGHIGHPEHARLTAIGEPANIAATLSSLTQFQNAGILASEELINIVETDVATGSVSHETINGREFAVYEILDFAKPDTHYLVQTSWERIFERRDEAAQIFYKKLFEIAPAVKPMFAHVDMATQGAMLMNMLSAAVRGLDHLEELTPVLQELGRRHAAYGVRVDHYPAVEACLLYTIEAMMGDDFNLDVKLAWTRIYNFIAETMIDSTN
ncbi:MAG TPA: protein kinase [Thermoanaerobaculia bacterium]|nr:protein kinase [Thermoanaerobaculia bacterium]